MTDPDRARYAIYFVPAAESELYRFGCSILGYDCYSGQDSPLLADLGPDTGDWRDLTAEPRRYGFHATLKAPFHLAPACSEAQLTGAIANFARLGHSVLQIAPDIRALGDFIAILPREPSPALNAFASQCTTIFDAYRAPLTQQERARRAASRLNAGQMQNLDRWGYPYVFDEFRFHMTLTGPVPSPGRDKAVAALRESFEQLCGSREIAIDRLTLLRQDNADARFRVLCQARLG